MRDPASAAGLLFGGFASLFAFGWMAEMLKGVDKIHDLFDAKFQGSSQEDAQASPLRSGKDILLGRNK